MRGFTVSGSSARVARHRGRSRGPEGAAIQTHGKARLDTAVEVEDKPMSRKEKREAGSERVCGVVGDREQDGERTRNRTLEGDPQQEPPLEVTSTRGESRPAAGGAHDAVVLDNTRKIKHVGPPARVDPERHREPVFGVPVKNGHRAAHERLAGKRLEVLFKPLR